MPNDFGLNFIPNTFDFFNYLCSYFVSEQYPLFFFIVVQVYV